MFSTVYVAVIYYTAKTPVVLNMIALFQDLCCIHGINNVSFASHSSSCEEGTKLLLRPVGCSLIGNMKCFVT